MSRSAARACSVTEATADRGYIGGLRAIRFRLSDDQLARSSQAGCERAAVERRLGGDRAGEELERDRDNA